ncbi:uncharacterized protein LOC124160624 [Ischnura elegans]|uniref:uncharacterized protein LOC124160624 n=1 Tax=Ischnura elegans TaxID=197161 RepID=UPI001ED8A769|nr:uncharacterized protein LOC124160624 [Ischnura elegans]
MELTFQLAFFWVVAAVGLAAPPHNGAKLDIPPPTSGERHLPEAILIRRRRFFDEDELEDIEKHLGEKIGKVCPAAKHWFDSHEYESGHQGGSHKTLGPGDAIHLALKIRRLKKAITILCREPTTAKPHKPQPHKPRPTYRPPYSVYETVPNLGGGILPDRVTRNLELRRYVIWPLRQWLGWPAGALASAFLLQ